MEEVYVIAYYGSVYSPQYRHPLGWKDVYVGEGIIHESKQVCHYPIPVKRYIELWAPKDKKYKYARVEKRFYPVEEEDHGILE